MFYSTKVGGGRSGGLHGYDLFAPKLPVLSSPQEFFSRSERCGEAQCVAFFRAPRLFPFSSFSHSNAVFFFYSTHYPTGPQIILPHPHPRVLFAGKQKRAGPSLLFRPLLSCSSTQFLLTYICIVSRRLPTALLCVWCFLYLELSINGV